jgi:flagella basal body P-ring formation protein FlgA
VQGQAKEDGSIGEQIRVLNLSSGKEVYAKVLDENTVHVDF